MINEQTLNGLSQLGFNSGWIVVDNEITTWENSAPQPTSEEIKAAGTLWAKNKASAEKEAVQAKTTAQAKLTALGLSENDLKALGL